MKDKLQYHFATKDQMESIHFVEVIMRVILTKVRVTAELAGE